MLTEENLKTLVQDIVPNPYKPKEGFDKVSNWPYVTSVEYVSKERLDTWIRNDGLDPKNVHAITMSWGILQRRSKVEKWEEAKLSYGIWLSEEIDVPVIGLAFTILHEIGHIDWAVRRSQLINWHGEDQESYADFYACECMSKLYGTLTATVATSRYGSITGLNARKDKKCQTQ